MKSIQYFAQIINHENAVVNTAEAKANPDFTTVLSEVGEGSLLGVSVGEATGGSVHAFSGDVGAATGGSVVVTTVVVPSVVIPPLLQPQGSFTTTGKEEHKSPGN